MRLGTFPATCCSQSHFAYLKETHQTMFIFGRNTIVTETKCICISEDHEVQILFLTRLDKNFFRHFTGLYSVASWLRVYANCVSIYKSETELKQVSSDWKSVLLHRQESELQWLRFFTLLRFCCVWWRWMKRVNAPRYTHRQSFAM